MRSLSSSIFIVSAAIALVGAGCAPRQAAKAPAAQTPSQKETPAAKSPATPAPAPEVTEDDLDRLKSDIQDSNFDDFTSLNE